MTVVLDTNVVLSARAAGHPNYVIVLALAAGAIQVALSTEILLEYEEIITANAGACRWRQFASVLEVAGQLHGNVPSIAPSFRFRLISADRDDDKFADCAIAAEADYIIVDDRHFDVLKTAGYKPQPITPEEFIGRHLTAA